MNTNFLAAVIGGGILNSVIYGILKLEHVQNTTRDLAPFLVSWTLVLLFALHSKE